MNIWMMHIGENDICSSRDRLVAQQIEKKTRFIVDRLIDFELADLIFVPYNPR